jgi:hypothetical protein
MELKKILATALHLPETATDVEIGYALADKTAPATPTTRLTDDPQAEFEAMARKAATTLGMSLSDAYSYVSREAPTLWERATKAAML